MLKSVSVKLFALLLTLALAYGAAEAKTIKETKVQTNMTCESCKTKIDGSLKKLNGVLETQSDLKSKVVLVKYDADLTNVKAITKNISDLGYQADVVKNQPIKVKANKECELEGKKAGAGCCGGKAKAGEAKMKTECKDKTIKTSAK
ncbi:MAG: heavy-metal-associated domain-containing protein [Chloroflexota bacterium]